MKKLFLLGLVATMLLYFGIAANAEETRVVRVGAFNFFPGIFKNSDGEIQGFYVDALTEIGRRENIRFEYVFGSWSEGLERLKSGEVDLLTSVAHTPEREEFMDYAKTPLLTVWGELYVPLESPIEGIRQIEKKKVALMKGDISGRNFIALVEKFHINCTFVELPGFDDVFKAVAEKKADAGVVSSVFGAARHKDSGLRSTGIVFNPFDIFFTVGKGKHQGLITTLDSYLTTWRQQKDSAYSRARQKWTYGSDDPTTPEWLIDSIVVLGGLMVAASGFIILLRRQVSRATATILQRETHLRESTEMVTLLLNSTAEAIYGLDTQGNCTFCNASCVSMLGYDAPEQLLGKNMHSLIHHHHVDGRPFDGRECSIFKSFQDGTETHMDDEVLWRSDGSSFQAEYWSHPIRHEGEIVGSVVTFLDITTRKQYEKELQDKNAELERFTYTVSHDLKSPLITIKSFAGSIRRDLAAGRSDRLDKDLTRIENSADRMSSLLSDLLELSRIGRIIAPAELVDMNELVNEVLNHLTGLLRENPIQITVQPGLPSLYCDRQRIAEVVQNLVENAVKYMGAQQAPRIMIGMRTEQGRQIFFIQDNGSGIDPRYHTTIFGLFDKLDAGSDGTGIGLALAKRIVEVHGGSLWVESEGSGCGSTFCFTLDRQCLAST